MKITFKSQNGFCPSCTLFGRIWFIQDKEIHTNTYEYCLMSKDANQPKTYAFKTKKEIAEFLNESKLQDNEITINYIINRHITINCFDVALVKRGKEYFRYNKVRNTLTEVKEEQQETGYFPTYLECLRMAKEMLEQMEQQNQLTLDLKG